MGIVSWYLLLNCITQNLPVLLGIDHFIAQLYLVGACSALMKTSPQPHFLQHKWAHAIVWQMVESFISALASH